MIEVSRDSWHAKVYLWWYRKKYEEYASKQSANLCPYVRVVLLWAPLRFLFTSVEIWLIPVSCITYPLLIFILAKLIGYHAYMPKLILLTLVGIIFAVEVGIVCIVAAIFFSELITEKYHLSGWKGRLANKIFYYLVEKPADAINAYFRRRRLAKGDKVAEPTFWSLMTLRRKSIHDRICPEVHFK